MKFVLALAVCFIVYCVFGYYCPVGESSCEMREDWYECYNPATEICCSDPESHGSGAICNATISQGCCYGTSISGEVKKILSLPVSKLLQFATRLPLRLVAFEHMLLRVSMERIAVETNILLVMILPLNNAVAHTLNNHLLVH